MARSWFGESIVFPTQRWLIEAWRVATTARLQRQDRAAPDPGASAEPARAPARHILIVGASSAIAEACARQWAERGDHLFLAMRSPLQLQAISDDLHVRGAASVSGCVFDANRYEEHAALLDDARRSMGGLDIVLIAHGHLTDQYRAEFDVDYALDDLRTNALSVVALMTLVACEFERQRRGTIAVISSVAGDRGRQSNYVYGSAKAMVSAFSCGLAQRLRRSGVDVVTIKPGFVDTPMTAHLPKNALWATPERVADDIVQAIERHKTVVYTPGFWRPTMFVLRHIPEVVFRRLRL